MAHSLPQQPAMTYSPQYDSRRSQGRASPYDIHSPLYDPHAPSYQQQVGQSPFKTPIASPALTSPGYSPTKSPSLESGILGKALSDASSTPSTPSRTSYHAAVHQNMRDSVHSNGSSNSHRSALTSPLPFSPTSDAEKAQSLGSPRHTTSSRTRSYGAATSRGQIERDEVSEVVLECKALKILIYLSAINIFTSILILFYTIFALLLVVFLQPIRLCSKRTTFRQQAIDFLSPTLKIQLAFIYSVADTQEYNVPLLVLIHIFSPMVSIGVAMAAWVAGAFWFFNAILGDPAGSDKPRGYNDGRASVIGVRRWWERWLTRALR